MGYVAQIAEISANTKRGARGLIVPAASLPGNPVENQMLPQTVTELQRLGLSPKEVALDGGFAPGATTEQLEDLQLARVFISGRPRPAPNPPNAACSATVPAPKDASATSKRGYGMHRSRLKDDEGQQIWTGWGILAYNLDTLTIRTA